MLGFSWAKLELAWKVHAGRSSSSVLSFSVANGTDFYSTIKMSQFRNWLKKEHRHVPRNSLSLISHFSPLRLDLFFSKYEINFPVYEKALGIIHLCRTYINLYSKGILWSQCFADFSRSDDSPHNSYRKASVIKHLNDSF